MPTPTAGDILSRQYSGKAEKAADILRSLLVGKNWQKRINLHQVFLFWREAVGQSIAAHAEPEVIRGTVLWLKVSDSVWMQQLHLQKMQLLEKLNSRLQGDKLSDLRFHLDVHSGTRPDEPDKKSGKKKKAPPLPPGLDNMIGLLDSTEMQQTLRRLWRRVKEQEPEKAEGDR